MGEQQQPPRREPRFTVRDAIEALHAVLLRRGFERRDPPLNEATTDVRWVASWMRDPPEERLLDARTPDGAPLRIGGADAVTVWSDSHVIFQVAEIFARLEWRKARLDADEFAYVVAGMVDQVDRFAPHTGPPLHRGGFTRN